MMQKHCLLTAIVVLASLVVSATSEGFSFYKLSLTWPPSTCNYIRKCRKDIPTHFTIHGLWPQFADDTTVPPYEVDKTCTTAQDPTKADDIVVELEPIEADLKAMWPNLMSKKDDMQFWKAEWSSHGMCSDYHNQPKEYFSAALTLAKNAIVYDPLAVMGIEYGKPYKVSTILENVKDNMGVYPQIACNKGKWSVLQLSEFRLCFVRTKPPWILQHCPKTVAGECKEVTDIIIFPAPAAVASTQ